MTPIWLTVAIITLVALATWLAVWSRRDTPARWLAVLVFLASIPTVAVAMTEALGRHKPFQFTRIQAGDYLVLSAVMRQNEAIWLYMIDPARAEPLPVVLPWQTETAQAIQDAMDGAPEGQEGQFVMRFDESLDDNEVQFHAIPQRPALPPKQAPEPGLTYTQPEG